MTQSISRATRYGATTNRTQALAHCWKITTTGGAIHRFTDWPQELSVREAEHGARFTYSPAYGADASATRREDELQSVNKEVRGVISSAAITDADLRAGRFDSAQVDEFLVNAQVPWLAYITHNRYWIRSVKYDRGVWRAECDGLPGFLDLPVGDIWSPFCRVDLFSAKCGLLESTFQNTTGVVASITTQRLVLGLTYSVAGGLAPWNTSGYGDDGTLVFTSGLNNGMRYAIKTHIDDATGGLYTLHAPTAYDVAVSDTVTLLPGCNKKSGAERDKTGTIIPGHCKDKFSNLVNFQGEPFIPGRDSAFKGLPIR